MPASGRPSERWRLPTLRQALLRDSGYIALNTVALVFMFVRVLSGRYFVQPFALETADYLFFYAASAWSFLEIATTLTSRKSRAVHDFIASTVVVRDRVAAADDPSMVLRGLPLACPRCGVRNPSRYYFAEPAVAESICTECARAERAAPP